MKIITVNIQNEFLEAMNKLIGENGLFPSRSELIRVATREFLIKELKLAKKVPNYLEKNNDEYDKKKFVRVPITDSKNPDAPIQQFKTYKIIKRLEF